jgi:hypothetical protein
MQQIRRGGVVDVIVVQPDVRERAIGAGPNADCADLVVVPTWASFACHRPDPPEMGRHNPGSSSSGELGRDRDPAATSLPACS